MTKYQAFDPNTEIIGQNVLGFLECVNKDRVRPFLEKHGLTDIQPDAWYPLQTWLDVLSDMSEQAGGGAMMDYVGIGMKIAETAVYPPEYAGMSFEDILMQSDATYQMQHRGGYVGEQSTEKVGEGRLVLRLKTPYPDDLAYGVVYGQARQFLPPGTDFTIAYDEDAPRFDQGGDWTYIHITWS
jgi:hypothetical protein